jgi:hypothetical protein
MPSFLLFILISILSSFMSCATAPNYEAPFDGVWDNAGVFKEELIPAESKGRWGYADSMGTMVISPQFSEAKPFSGGKAAVRVHNKWGYIHRDGRLFIVPSFLDAGTFSDGRAAVRTAEGWGYIDDQGKMVIPADYDEAGSFSQGLAAVRLSQRWGYIDKKGKVAINFQFKQALAFSNDLAPAAEMKDDNEWGFIDTEGKFVIKPAFVGPGRSRTPSPRSAWTEPGAISTRTANSRSIPGSKTRETSHPNGLRPRKTDCGVL